MRHDLSMQSKVHPKYKTKYRVNNWPEYDRALLQRGDITLWISDEAMAALDLIDHVEGDIASLTADSADDTFAIYDASTRRGGAVIVPPSKSATRSRQRRSRSNARDRTIMRVKEIGRRRWKKETGYHEQARVENAFFRYKSIIGDKIRARHPATRLGVSKRCLIR
jgi:hypothetical protein